MSLTPSFSIDSVNNTGLMDLYNGLDLFATYEFDNSAVTISPVVAPTIIIYSIFQANVVLLEKWITLLKENLSIEWSSSEKFTSEVKTKNDGLTSFFKLTQFLSNVSYDNVNEEFTILPSPSQIVSFTIFERWAKHLRRTSNDARIFI